MIGKLKKEIEFVLEFAKGYAKGSEDCPQKAQMLDKLLNKKELTNEDKIWIAKSSDVTVFEQAMLYTLSKIVFAINHAEED